jgi:hypothetical protein
VVRRFLARLVTPDDRVCLSQEEATALRRVLARTSGRIELHFPVHADVLWLLVIDLRDRQARALRRHR